MSSDEAQFQRALRETGQTFAPEPPLTAQDRCDGCGAAAYHRVTMNAGNELLFCNHHATKHGEALAGRYSHWQDESDRLLNEYEEEGEV